MKQTSRAQKVSFFVAILSYIAAIGSLFGTIYYAAELGGDHPVAASFGAAVVFFVGAGIVLHVIGRVDLPNLKIKSTREHDDKPDLK
ncbi:hemerythrin family protein [Sedimenticola hydrogenitrophicus]|uniref:hemerythrin family protein n=1 Tax=Sedimenticola hydrogenitrophicus TaxID=2967975 RepID=UPI0021A63A7A|nr:hemerythrin family protein [Sedimenticola hydrogenitrophicus]